MANIVRQVTPLSMPGFHRGIILMTRMASLSSNGSTDFTTLGDDMEPSLLMMNDTTTLPWIFCCCACSG